MVAKKERWSDLSPRTRRLIIVGAVSDGILKVMALIDMKRRPASQIRGPKWVWAVLMAVVGSAGALPISYFLLGRKQTPSQPDLANVRLSANGPLPPLPAVGIAS